MWRYLAIALAAATRSPETLDAAETPFQLAQASPSPEFQPGQGTPETPFQLAQATPSPVFVMPSPPPLPLPAMPSAYGTPPPDDPFWQPVLPVAVLPGLPGLARSITIDGGCPKRQRT